MQAAVVPLWSLLEACRAGSETEQEQAARAAQVAMSDLGSCEGCLMLELVDERLVIDGFPVVSGIDTFAATQGLMGFLYAAGMLRVQFAQDVSAASLVAWGAHVVAKTAPVEWPAGIDAVRRSDTQSNEVVSPHPSPRPSAEESDSRLRSVFLQHRLIAGLPPIDGVDPMTAKLVIEGVVDRLLQVAGGL